MIGGDNKSVKNTTKDRHLILKHSANSGKKESFGF